MRDKILSLFPICSLALFFLPIILGLMGTVLPAFGLFPAAGLTEFTFKFIHDFCAFPGVSHSIFLTIGVGIFSTCLAFFVSLFWVSSFYNSIFWNKIERRLGVFLAVPHVAFAIGFTLLCAPSGMVFRFLAFFCEDLQAPLDFTFISDPYGLSLALVLAIKETLFLAFMAGAALSQISVGRILAVGRSLGYSKGQVWLHLIIPQLYPHLRLPLMAVLAYSLSVVDLGILVGPSLPPTLSVLVNSWFYSPDVEKHILGAVGASFLASLVFCCCLLLLLVEKLVGIYARSRRVRGVCYTKSSDKVYVCRRILKKCTWYCFIGILTLSFFALIIQSVALRWRYPAFLPTKFSLRFWEKGWEQALEPLWNAFSIGFCASAVALFLVIGCLEYELVLAKKGKQLHLRRSLLVLYTPLLVPQISFLFGCGGLASFLGIEGHFTALVFGHLIFVLPYVFLTLATPYRNYDMRNSMVSLSLGKTWWQTLWRVKIPLLCKLIFFSLAVGFSISIMQYLPTLYMGAGRYATITTEAVTIASGSDGRIIAVFALLQCALPALGFLVATFIPRLIYTPVDTKKICSN